MNKDGKMTDDIIEEAKRTVAAANTRKGEIMKLFQEVQKTQNTLNQNLLAELKAQLEEKTTTRRRITNHKTIGN